MKPRILLFAAALVSSLGINLVAARDAATNGRFSLDGQWRFALAKNADEADAKYDKFYEAWFDSSAFKPITMQSDWVTNDEFEERNCDALMSI